MNQPLDLNLLPPAYQSKRGITAMMVINILLTITLTMGAFTAYQQLALYRQHREVLELRREQLQLELVRRNALKQSIADLEERLRATREQTQRLKAEFAVLMEGRPRRSASLAMLVDHSQDVHLTHITQVQDQITLEGEIADTAALLAYARALQDGEHFQQASILSLEQREDRVAFILLLRR